MRLPSTTPGASRVQVMLSLIGAVFVISLSFGLNMPLLPPLIETLPGRPADGRIALHAGLLAAVFTFALGAAAPIWGALSDRIGRRPLLILGMGGFAGTMLTFSVPSTLAALYAEQLLSGLAAAAVMPVANALVADLAPDDHWRASRLAWLNMALVAGFILGPVAGASPELLLLPRGATGVLVVPFLATSLAAALAAVLLWWFSPRQVATARRSDRPAHPGLWPLLTLTFGISAAIGVFEVAIAVRGGRTLALTPQSLSILFAACSVLMFAGQAAVFSRSTDPGRTARLVAPAFVGMSLGLAAAAVATGMFSYAAAVALFAVSGGVLVPVLAYWVSRVAGGAQGTQLGRQTAAAGLGQAAGSAFAGLTFEHSSASPWGLLVAAGAGLGLAVYARTIARGLL